MFPAAIAQFEHLVSLNLAKNELDVVPSAIAIPTLIKLDLSNNRYALRQGPLRQECMSRMIVTIFYTSSLAHPAFRLYLNHWES